MGGFIGLVIAGALRNRGKCYGSRSRSAAPSAWVRVSSFAPSPPGRTVRRASSPGCERTPAGEPAHIHTDGEGGVDFEAVVETTGKAIEGAGVAVIVVGMLGLSVRFARDVAGRGDLQASYRRYRRGIGRAILLGLEFLVAGDIIRTVAVSPTFTSVGVLAIIVAIRTFLSFSLEAELEGRWPWQRPRTDA
ncbi:hypothetical protein GCM10027447_17840 [Glycomyces halotolerans]